jgi:hypothetical protein
MAYIPTVLQYGAYSFKLTTSRVCLRDWANLNRMVHSNSFEALQNPVEAAVTVDKRFKR